MIFNPGTLTERVNERVNECVADCAHSVALKKSHSSNSTKGIPAADRSGRVDRRPGPTACGYGHLVLRYQSQNEVKLGCGSKTEIARDVTLRDA